MRGLAARGTLTPGYDPGLALRIKAVRKKSGKFGVGSHDEPSQSRRLVWVGVSNK